MSYIVFVSIISNTKNVLSLQMCKTYSCNEEVLDLSCMTNVICINALYAYRNIMNETEKKNTKQNQFTTTLPCVPGIRNISIAF